MQHSCRRRLLRAVHTTHVQVPQPEQSEHLSSGRWSDFWSRVLLWPSFVLSASHVVDAVPLLRTLMHGILTRDSQPAVSACPSLASRRPVCVATVRSGRLSAPAFSLAIVIRIAHTTDTPDQTPHTFDVRPRASSPSTSLLISRGDTPQTRPREVHTTGGVARANSVKPKGITYGSEVYGWDRSKSC